MKYTFFDSGKGGVGGGLAPRQSHSPPHPLHYVMCTDLPATLERILSNGGTVVTSATEFGDAGWLAYVIDTEGNLFGLWQVKQDA